MITGVPKIPSALVYRPHRLIEHSPRVIRWIVSNASTMTWSGLNYCYNRKLDVQLLCTYKLSVLFASVTRFNCVFYVCGNCYEPDLRGRTLIKQNILRVGARPWDSTIQTPRRTCDQLPIFRQYTIHGWAARNTYSSQDENNDIYIVLLHRCKRYFKKGSRDEYVQRKNVFELKWKLPWKRRRVCNLNDPFNCTRSFGGDFYFLCRASEIRSSIDSYRRRDGT